MKKCKNNECNENVKKDSNVYCSLRCRNIYVNKNLRDYTLISESLSKKRKEYEKKPNKCKECKSKIEYKSKLNLFCSTSCSASYNNRGRIHSEDSIKKIKNKLIDFYADKITIIQCLFCGNDIPKRLHRKYCNKDCSRKNKRKLLGNYEIYKFDCSFKFNLADYPKEFDFSLLKKYGMYKAKNRGDNLGGVSKDHIYSISEGYKNGVPSNIISHPANCQLMVHKYNISKNSKSHISLKDLNEKIEKWNNKYNK